MRLLLCIAVAALVQAPMPPFRSIEQGTMSGIATPRQVAVRDGDAWTALWRQHAPDRTMPAVDFSRDMVVGVFLGARPTSGFGATVVGYRDDGARIVVQYRETMPPPGAAAAQVIVTPYHLVALPRRQGAITFEKLPA